MAVLADHGAAQMVGWCGSLFEPSGGDALGTNLWPRRCDTGLLDLGDQLCKQLARRRERPGRLWDGTTPYCAVRSAARPM
jgi:hypothetical protein